MESSVMDMRTLSRLTNELRELSVRLGTPAALRAVCSFTPFLSMLLASYLSSTPGMDLWRLRARGGPTDGTATRTSRLSFLCREVVRLGFPAYSVASDQLG